MTKYIYIIVSVLMSMAASAASYTTVTIDNIGYRLYDETMEAHVYLNTYGTQISVPGNRLELPRTVKNDNKTYTVTEIEHFECGNTTLTLVTPATMTKVVDVKRGVKVLVLGESVASVSGLYESTNLEGFEIAEGNESFSVDDKGVLFNKDKTTLYFAPYGKRSSFGSYSVPSTVTEIGAVAFSRFDQLESIILPEGLKTINSNVFYDCNKLVSCKLPSTVESIGDRAFYSCPLTGLSLPSELRSIGEYAFAYGLNRYIRSISLPANMESIGNYAFYNVTVDSVYAHCKPFNLSQNEALGSPSDQTLVVPKGTRDIFSTNGAWKKINDVIEGDFEPTFDVSEYSKGSTSLDNDGQVITQADVTYKLYKSGVAKVYCYSSYGYGYTPSYDGAALTIPESVYFRGLDYRVDAVEYFETSGSYIVDLLLPNTVTSVNNVKRGVKTLKLPKSVTSVSGLYESTNLEGFEIAEGNESFSVDDKGVLFNKDKTTLYFAPYGKRSSFGSYSVPSTVTEIGAVAFSRFDQLESIILPEGLKTINSNVFYDCNKLVSCKLPSTVESIGDRAFYSCPLTGLSLPSELRSIGEYAFAYGLNRYIRSISLPANMESIGNYAFYNVTVDSVYSYIMSPLPISNYAFGNQSNVKLVVPTGTKGEYQLMGGWSLMTDITESDKLLPSATKCATPKFVRNKNVLTITTEPSDAVIYYTLDGKDPTESSQVFDAENPIELTENCTVKAIAMKTDIKNSEIATFTVDWFKVEDVVIGITEDLMIEMKTKTGTRAEGVTIRYTLNGEDPAVSGHEYHDKAIYVEEDCTIKAVGIKKNFHNSDITTYELKWASMTCPTPEFRLADKKLYIEVKNMENTTIYYTLSGEEPTEKSLIYTPGEPVELSANCTVKAIATKKGYRKSAVGSFDASPFVVSTPTFSDAGTSLTINCETEGSEIYYGIGENVEPTIRYQSPITLTDNRPVRAMAKKEGYKDSEIAVFTHSKITCDPATLEKYDGRYFTLNVPEGSTAYYTLDGSDPRENGYEYSGITALTDLCTLRFVAKHQYKNDSDVKNVEIKYFSDDESAKIKEAGQLQQALEWQDVKSVKTLKINGPLNATDYAYIRNEMTSVEHLNLEDATVDNNTLPDEAFAGMQSLISFTSPKNDVTKVGERILANCPKLAAVVWNLVKNMGDSAFGDNKNPNMLVYVVNSAFAPSGTRNRIVNGTANTIVLSDEGVNGNFYCPKAFKTNSISYVRNFSMKTEIGKSMGWETIVLPFTVQKIVDSQGEIIPYKKFEEGGSDKIARPFWLRGLATGGFEDVSSIEANTPYIISMPNNEKYASHYNITGNVTFLAENVNIGVTEPIVTNNGSISFVPCFQKKDASPDVWALNVNQEYDGKPAGSVFVPSLRDVKPFEAHTTISNTSSARAIIYVAEMMNRDNITDIDNILYDRSSEMKSEDVKVYTISGVLFKTGKRSDVMKQLPAGMYVVDGKKIVIM